MMTHPSFVLGFPSGYGNHIRASLRPVLWYHAPHAVSCPQLSARACRMLVGVFLGVFFDNSDVRPIHTSLGTLPSPRHRCTSTSCGTQFRATARSTIFGGYGGVAMASDRSVPLPQTHAAVSRAQYSSIPKAQKKTSQQPFNRHHHTPSIPPPPLSLLPVPSSVPLSP